MVNKAEWEGLEPVEVPVRASGKRSSARNRYTICPGCSEFLELDPSSKRTSTISNSSTSSTGSNKFDESDYDATHKDHWHEECFRERYEHDEPEEGNENQNNESRGAEHESGTVITDPPFAVRWRG